MKSQPSLNSNCPEKRDWIHVVLNESKMKKAATIVVIGCNKGDDFISQLGAWSGNASYDPVKYVKILNNKYHIDDFACSPAKRIDFDQELRSITGYCIEPMPVNYKLLGNMINEMNFDTSFVKLFPLAMSAFPEVALFPNVSDVGIESLGLGHVTGKPNFLINVTNIDSFVRKERIGIIDFLSIDTEGYDGMVILGMVKTLYKQYVRVFEFEFHSYAPWNEMVIIINFFWLYYFFYLLLLLQIDIVYVHTIIDIIH
jgi:FkbM family methyltransferase